MRKFTSKLAASYFDENDIGCQEKKSLGKQLDEDDLQQIAKEKYIVGLIKTFARIEEKVSIDDFWRSLEPKLKYIKNKPNWRTSPSFEGMLTVSFNKQYYLDLSAYYIDAKIDDDFIYFNESEVKKVKEFQQMKITRLQFRNEQGKTLYVNKTPFRTNPNTIEMDYEKYRTYHPSGYIEKFDTISFMKDFQKKEELAEGNTFNDSIVQFTVDHVLESCRLRLISALYNGHFISKKPVACNSQSVEELLLHAMKKDYWLALTIMSKYPYELDEKMIDDAIFIATIHGMEDVNKELKLYKAAISKIISKEELRFLMKRSVYYFNTMNERIIQWKEHCEKCKHPFYGEREYSEGRIIKEMFEEENIYA